MVGDLLRGGGAQPQIELARALELDQVLAQVSHSGGDRARLDGLHELGVLLAQHEGAGRARGDDGVARLHVRQEAFEVVLDLGEAALDVSAVEVGHPAAARRGRGDQHARSLEHEGRGLGDLRVVVVVEAGVEEDRFRLAVRAGLGLVWRQLRGLAPLAPPGVEPLVGPVGQLPVAVDADGLLHQHAAYGAVLDGVGQGGDRGHHGTDGVGGPEEAVLQRDPFIAGLDRLGPEHEAREVHRELVRGDVGADREAELAVVAEVDHPLEVAWGEAIDRVVGGDGDVRERAHRVLFGHRRAFGEQGALRVVAVGVERVDAV